MDATSAPAAAAARGLVLDGRYRLETVRDERTLADGREVVLWRATDESLDRHVAVLVVTGRTQKTRKRMADAATRASRVSDGRWVRVLDVGEIALPDNVAATWVATEWVEGPSLTALLRREPMRTGVAAELVRQCAEALSVAEREGCRHGHLHPDHILLPGTGLPRITGLEIAAALEPADDAAAGPSARDDVRGLGAVLFAALTGRWPLPGWSGLPAPPQKDPPGHPRSLRSGVSRDLDQVTARALAGDYADPGQLATALASVPTEPLDAPPPPPQPGRSIAVRAWAWRIVPPVLVVVIGVAGWEVGSNLGRVPLSARSHHAVLPPASAGGPGSGQLSLVWTQPPTVTSFDPEGDGQENPDAVGLAVDRDPSTSWTTATYRGSARFGGLKSGVGLLLDLGQPTTVRVAELALTASGSNVELRAGDNAPSQAADLPLVSQSTAAPASLRWQLTAPVRARYWLVWFTSLPKVTGGFRIGIADIALLG